MNSLDRAVQAIEAGEAVVYPTETVYGLGADATDARAVERVFSLKRRDREKPLSVAVPSVDAVGQVAHPSEKTRAFMEAFLPGPVTVICQRRADLPDILTAGRERVGIRIPELDLALSLLEQTPPLTATSANLSGGPNARHPDELDDAIRNGVGAVIDGGRTPGTPSTVVDVEANELYRRGQFANAVEAWLEDHNDSADSP